MGWLAKRIARLVVLNILLGSSRVAYAAEESSLDEWLDEDFKIPLWYKSFNLAGGLGYKDNLLLSSVDPQSSAYWRSALEVLVFRLPTRGWTFNFFLSAEANTYFDRTAVDNEQVVIAFGQATKELGRGWKLGVGANYLFQNQVFDVTATETNNYTIGKVLGHGLTGTLPLRKNFKAWWVALEPSVLRQWFDAPLDDYWQYGARFMVGRSLGLQSELSFAGQLAYAPYDTREQVDAGGLPLTGSLLAFYPCQFELAWEQTWGPSRRWQLRTGPGLDINWDNGSGYFDYTYYRYKLQLKYRRASWELSGRFSLGYYEFPRQPVSPTDPARRHKTSLGVNVNAEKTVFKQLKIFANYYHDRSFSNRSWEEYAANAITGGVDWEF